MSYKRLTKLNGEPKTIFSFSGSMQDFKIYKRLQELEDKIENGTLIELPCKMGDSVYTLYCCGFHDWKMTEGKIVKIVHELGCENKFIKERKKRNNDVFHYFVDMGNLNKTVFLTKAEAEKKLKELQGIK